MLSRLAVTALALATGAAAQVSKDASVGTWPYLVGNMDPQITALVADVRSNDLDTIYVNVFRATGPSAGTLWVSDSAGQWNAAWGPVRTGGRGLDLTVLIREAHAAGLQVVGVIKCFDDTVQPSSATHRAYLLDVIDYLLGSFDGAGRPVYDLDGLALDYIRWVGVGCSGVNAAVVTDFVREVKARLGARSLHAYVLANRYTFHGPAYSGPFHSYSSVLSTNRDCYGQDWEQLCRYVDVMMPMAYTANGSIYSTWSEHHAYVRQVAAYCRTACQRGGFPARRVTPAVRCYNEATETATAQTIDASIVGALDGGADGYQAFRYATMQNAWWTPLRDHAVPGPNRPIPDLQVATAGLGTTLDATSSVDADQASSTLTVRFDQDNDGVFETAWLGNSGAHVLVARRSGTSVVGMQVRDADGHVGATVRRFTTPVVLSVGPSILSAQSGGAVGLSLDTGPATSGFGYLVLGGLSGSSPGTPLGGGLQLPLNFDGLTGALLTLVNTPVLQNGLGTLDANGRAAATFAVPPMVLGGIAWQRITWAAVGIDGYGQLVFVTNPMNLVIVP